ncbi:MAG: lipid-A-disaccharide synthase [Saprospiraceae bacterium]|nr:lipid-A-disaccharide synthase [Saprospiraceae bacterium]MCB9325926.1 lipid-A-disaccharide synthase [Lewinellaceae bacterium]
MRYYIIAGEASGDLHASNLMKSLTRKDPEAQFRCWGGDLMQAAGGDLVKHFRELAFMGFWEVAKNIRTILRNMKFCKSDILQWKPDVIILVDYPGFNLRIAKWAKSHGICVFYYISPQIWAWKEKRVHEIREHVNRMYVILPFEKDFYKKYDYEVDFVGHPLLDVISNYRQDPDFRVKNQLDDRPVIALLPGSRKQEINAILSEMLKVVVDFPDHQFVVAGAPSIPPDIYEAIIGKRPVSVVFAQTYDLLSEARAALVTSGTATLETALFNVPQVVCYRGSYITYYLIRAMIKVPYISLVNLILNRSFLKELIQGEFNRSNLRKELSFILDKKNATLIHESYHELKKILGENGASEKAADLMYKAATICRPSS